MAEVAHPIDEPLKGGLELAEGVFLSFAQHFDYLRPILFVYLFLEDVVLLLRQLQAIVKLFILHLHFLSDEFEELSAILPRFVQVRDGRGVVYLLIVLQGLQFSEPPSHVLDVFNMFEG